MGNKTEGTDLRSHCDPEGSLNLGRVVKLRSDEAKILPKLVLCEVQDGQNRVWITPENHGAQVPENGAVADGIVPSSRNQSQLAQVPEAKILENVLENLLK